MSISGQIGIGCGAIILNDKDDHPGFPEAEDLQTDTLEVQE